MRVFLGILLGLVLFFLGIPAVQWLGQDLLGYKDMTVTDGCLVMIIILLSVIIVTRMAGQPESEQFQPPQPTSSGPEASAYPQQQPRRGVRGSSQRSSRQPATSRHAR